MVTAMLFLVVHITLNKWSTSEFPTPNDQSVIEQTTLFEVFDQAGCRLIGIAGLNRQLRWQIVVLIPPGVHQLDKTHALLG
jgi:hypothetical protein